MDEDTNPIPEDQSPPADDSRAAEQVSDAELLDALTTSGAASDELAADDERLREMIGEAEEPSPAPADSAPAITNNPLGEEPERPAIAAHDYEADAKTLDDLAGERDIESFGQQLHDFQEAGGADNGVPNLDDNSGDEQHDATEQLNDADFGFKSRASDMLIEQARRIDELTRGLEAERL